MDKEKLNTIKKAIENKNYLDMAIKSQFLIKKLPIKDKIEKLKTKGE